MVQVCTMGWACGVVLRCPHSPSLPLTHTHTHGCTHTYTRSATHTQWLTIADGQPAVPADPHSVGAWHDVCVMLWHGWVGAGRGHSGVPNIARKRGGGRSQVCVELPCGRYLQEHQPPRLAPPHRHCSVTGSVSSVSDQRRKKQFGCCCCCCCCC